MTRNHLLDSPHTKIIRNGEPHMCIFVFLQPFPLTSMCLILLCRLCLVKVTFLDVDDDMSFLRIDPALKLIPRGKQ